MTETACFQGFLLILSERSNTVFQVPFDLVNSVNIPAGGTMRIRIDPFATGTAVAIPEPASLTLAGIGSLGLLGYTWYRRKRAIA
jgi:LPXTG-motif cell wall-anchored protein